jgi:bacillopeptidase F (M6 metalloprotease family)
LTVDGVKLVNDLTSKTADRKISNKEKMSEMMKPTKLENIPPSATWKEIQKIILRSAESGMMEIVGSCD